MARSKEQYVCDACGVSHVQWQGRCSTCGEWNTLKPFHIAQESKGATIRTSPGFALESPALPQRLSEVSALQEQRWRIGMEELDRVLGGGLVPGSVILIGGDPGIGKSTLLLEVLAALSPRESVLYVSGEESLTQLKLRADRLGVDGSQLWVMAENRLEAIEAALDTRQPRVMVADSIQTLASDDLPAAAGTVTQVRACAARLIQFAKRRGTAVFLVGHVTKDGQIAGPRVLEHMVDTVLYFEGERGHQYRILRAVKNRFGPANEIGVFEMREEGLVEVPNPSELFLAERTPDATGSVVFAGLEGTRPVLVEIQALVAPSPFPQPRRTTVGIDANRLAMLIAVLEKRIGLGLHTHDIFLNVAGGFRITEPGADLAVMVAIFASHFDLRLDPGWVIMGEVGLSGEIRTVAHAETRLREAAKLGFSRCMLPAKSLKNISKAVDIETIPVSTIEQVPKRLAVQGNKPQTRS
jgi:DNA repair protein RadA/Sms